MEKRGRIVAQWFWVVDSKQVTGVVFAENGDSIHSDGKVSGANRHRYGGGYGGGLQRSSIWADSVNSVE